MKTKITNKDIAKYLSTKLIGNEYLVDQLERFPNHSLNSISFLSTKIFSTHNFINNITIITIKENIKYLKNKNCALIISDYPKFDFARVFENFFNYRKESFTHKSAVIGNNVVLDKKIYISPNVVIGDNVVIKKGVYLGANVVIEKNVIINENVSIRNGTVIGGRAFNFGLKNDCLVKDSQRLPGDGKVIIKKNVEIGNNCVISRGVFENTIIGENSRINDLTHIGNSVVIGKNTLIMANVDISARVEIGDKCWIAQSSCIRQGISIGNNVQVGMGAVVVKDINNNTVVYGAPAKFIKKR